jgi:hypothetical protein
MMKKIYEKPEIEIVTFNMEMATATSSITNADIIDCYSTEIDD